MIYYFSFGEHTKTMIASEWKVVYWILRTLKTRDVELIRTLFEVFVLSRFDILYVLVSHYKVGENCNLEMLKDKNHLRLVFNQSKKIITGNG